MARISVLLTEVFVRNHPGFNEESIRGGVGMIRGSLLHGFYLIAFGSMLWMVEGSAFTLAVSPLAGVEMSTQSVNETTAEAVAKVLASLDTWILAQPKMVRALPGVSFDLTTCKGIESEASEKLNGLLQWASGHLSETSGVSLPLLAPPSTGPVIKITLVDRFEQYPFPADGDADLFNKLGQQGYVLVVDTTGVTLMARGEAGIRYAVITLSQIATGRTLLPGMVIKDWPSLRYRGAQQDISRGQVPTTGTLKRLADVIAEAKMNQLELYIEHLYKYKAFPDIAPPEGLSPEEAQDLSAHAARMGVEVHPLLQVLGHSFGILNKPQYQHLRIGPCEKSPWIMTFDVRKPEAVQMITTMIDELCEVFPGELFNVDITEIDIDGLQSEGLTLGQITDLVFEYVLKLNEAVKKHGRRLMITQGPLDSQGHLSGMGPKLDSLPKDIIIGSYYCAGGPYQPAWEKDFPRLQEKGIDFFAQAWIYSHVWLTPWVNKSVEFSGLEVSRGLKHGATGSITCDWGDAGHFHFVGEEWLPYLYHGACAWTGDQMDRDYFRRAYAFLLHGLKDDAAIRAIEAASDVNSKQIQVRDKEGKETSITTNFIWEFVHDPFTHPDITRIADPAAVGGMLLESASPALTTLLAETPKAKRNRDNLNQWIFGIRCYLALGHKLIALGHYNDSTIPRQNAATELESVAREYEELQTAFGKLWLAEDRDNDGYKDLLNRFNNTIVPCREKAKALETIK